MNNAAQAYLSTQVETTTQGELLLMLYEAAIKFLKQAKVKMRERDFAQKGVLISRAISIISELAESLNIEKGGELASRLASIYLFCNTHLARANLYMDTAKVDEIIRILSGLHSAYAQIVPSSNGQPREAAAQTAAAVAPAPPIIPQPRPEVHQARSEAPEIPEQAAEEPETPEASQAKPASSGQYPPMAGQARSMPRPAPSPEAAPRPPQGNPLLNRALGAYGKTPTS